MPSRAFPVRGDALLQLEDDVAVSPCVMVKQDLRMLIVDAARAVLIARSNDPEVRREIAALLGSLDGNLSNEQVLEKLKALRVGASSKTKFRHSR